MGHYEHALTAAAEVGDLRLQGSIQKRKGQLLAAIGHYAEAASLLQQAMELHLSIGQANRAIMAEAGLAELALKRDNLPLACTYVEAILSHFETRQLQQTDEWLAAYMNAFRVLQAAQDPRAAAVLRAARKQLTQRAAIINDEAQLTAFWAATLHANVMNQTI